MNFILNIDSLNFSVLFLIFNICFYFYFYMNIDFDPILKSILESISSQKTL